MIKFLSLCCIILFTPTAGKADFWNLPNKLGVDNTKVQFEVDSTWHLIKGKVQELSGELYLKNKGDFSTVRGEIIFPISSFNTDSESRDEKMRTVMHTQNAPNVAFKISDNAVLNCNPETVESGVTCKTELPGYLTINHVTRDIKLSLEVVKSGGKFIVTGTANLHWRDYGVEDPSILIATLKEVVTVKFTVNLESTK